MGYLTLQRISACLLVIATLGHTFGGMLGTARRGSQAGPEADAVFTSMKATHFKWQGADCTWFNFWMGNGLGVSALLVLAVVVLWVLGGLAPGERAAMRPVAWAVFGSLALLAIFGFRYFTPMIGAVFGVIAMLTGIAAVTWNR
jgi:hypothetical protein